MSRVLRKLAETDPRVDDFSDESDGRGGANGYWLYLAPGWVCGWDESIHCVHEWTVKATLEAFRMIRPCPGPCEECIHRAIHAEAARRKACEK